MKILALERDLPYIPESRFTDERLKQEAMQAWQLHQSGVIRELYFRANHHAAV